MTPHPPRVPVVIPTHNRRDLLCAAVDSVLAQTYAEVEIIVVDDGSSDDTIHPGEFFFFASAAVIRRECLEQVELFDESLAWGEDAEVQAWQAALSRFFADPDLPDDIRELEPEAHSILHYETAGRYYRIGDVDQAQYHLCQAVRACRSLGREWLPEWLAGTALDPRTATPDEFMNLVFDNLIPEATTFRAHRRRAHGRYHTAAAFAAHQRGDWAEVHEHVLPALRGDPAILRNLGFLRLIARSMFTLRVTGTEARNGEKATG